jgi:predicted deacetylase
MLRDNALGNFRDILVSIAGRGDAVRLDGYEHAGEAAGEFRA